MPQRHFTRRPDFDFSRAASTDVSITAGTNGYYCGFDSLENSNAGISSAANNVVLAGTQGGLDVYRLLRQRTEIVGRLEGLRGAVIDAKILPWIDRDDPFRHLRPLVMCVVHGPTAEHKDRLHEAAPNVPAATSLSFKTTVDVFSLATAELLCCIYESPLKHGHIDSPPKPIGNLRISAEGRFITVTSGTSGEVYVYSPYASPPAHGVPPIRCVAKFWTTVTSCTAPSTDGSAAQREDTGGAESKTAITALSARWLALRPPVISSSQISLQGSPLLSPEHPDPPGVSTHASPPCPSVNCNVQAPFSNTLLDRLTKQATQEMMKGLGWANEHGKQLWNAYWNRQEPTRDNVASPPPRHTVQTDASLFPPTHAQNSDTQSAPVDPALISLIDLNRLLEHETAPSKGTLAPLSTFPLVDGCSFLSFAPTGLSLLTTNQSGDTSTIWDLTRCTNGVAPARNTAAADIYPRVCMITRLARQSPSVVTEVAWSAHGERVAILTQKGTIHLHEVPSIGTFVPLSNSGASWPAAAVGGSPGSSPQGDAPIGIVGTIKARLPSFQALRPPANANSLGATVSSASAYARHTSRRALKQGVNMATDTALKIKHHEETKIRLHPKQHALRASCLRWLSGRENGLIATVFDGRVRLHSAKSNHYVQNKRTASYLTASRRPVIESALQPISGGNRRAEGDNAACDGAGPHGFWFLNKSHAAKKLSAGRTNLYSAEVVQDKDTSPTYLPFHRAPQVNMFTFNEPDSAALGLGADTAWVFGTPVNATTRITCPQTQIGEDHKYEVGGGEMEDVPGDFPGSLGRTGFADHDT